MRKYIGKINSPSLDKRYRRKLAIRKKINGSSDRPRICAIRSNKHLVVQVVDDVVCKTLFSVQTFGKNAVEGGANNVLGAKVAELLKSKKLIHAVFDRSGFKYTGVIAALAQGIRENGIQI